MTPAPFHEFRRLGASDVGLMRDLLACFADAFDEPETYLAAQPSSDYLAFMLRDDSSFIALVAIEQGAVIGGLCAYELRKFEQERSEFYIYDLAVGEAHRRRGIATALIQRLQAIARAKGAWVIFVEADLVDVPAIALYSTLGVGEDTAHFDIPV